MMRTCYKPYVLHRPKDTSRSNYERDSINTLWRWLPTCPTIETNSCQHDNLRVKNVSRQQHIVSSNDPYTYVLSRRPL